MPLSKGRALVRASRRRCWGDQLAELVFAPQAEHDELAPLAILMMATSRQSRFFGFGRPHIGVAHELQVMSLTIFMAGSRPPAAGVSVTTV